jgi:hypothetical protein
MTIRTTVLGACTSLLILGAASLPANAEHGRNGAIAGGAAAGLAAGAILGGALAAQPAYSGPGYGPGYVGGPGYPTPAPGYASGPAYSDEDCHIIRHRVWMPGYGWQIRREEVCD